MAFHIIIISIIIIYNLYYRTTNLTKHNRRIPKHLLMKLFVITFANILILDNIPISRSMLNYLSICLL